MKIEYDKERGTLTIPEKDGGRAELLLKPPLPVLVTRTPAGCGSTFLVEPMTHHNICVTRDIWMQCKGFFEEYVKVKP